MNTPPILPKDGWIRGWFQQPESIGLFFCHRKGHRTATASRVFLTGLHGEVFCEKHAPKEARDGGA